MKKLSKDPKLIQYSKDCKINNKKERRLNYLCNIERSTSSPDGRPTKEGCQKTCNNWRDLNGLSK